jgi:hypothetical protein
VTQCSLVKVYRRFEGTYFHSQVMQSASNKQVTASNYGLLGRDAVYFGGWVSEFAMNLLHSYSGKTLFYSEDGCSSLLRRSCTTHCYDGYDWMRWYIALPIDDAIVREADCSIISKTALRSVL